MNIKQKRAEQARHVNMARRIVDHYRGKPMPAEKAAEAQAHVDAANRVKAEIEAHQSEPQYRHDMSDSSGMLRVDGKTQDRRGGVQILTKDQKVTDLYDSSNLRSVEGFLGVLAKSMVGDVSAKETAHFLGSSHKDLLATGGAGVLVPEPVAAFVIDRLRARSSVVNRLGARTVPMNSATLKVPRITDDAAPGWIGEGDPYGGTDADLDDVTFTAHKLAQIIKFSEELDEDSDPELAGEILAGHLATVFALELDRAALRGDGQNDTPTGVRNQSGVQVDALAGAADWTTLTGAKRDLELANSEATGFVWNPRTADAVENEKDATSGQFINPPKSIDEIPRVATTAVPNDLGGGTDTEIYAGRWSDLMIGLRTRFELRRLNERYADEGKVALRARLRADVQLAHAESFVVKTGVSN